MSVPIIAPICITAVNERLDLRSYPDCIIRRGSHVFIE